MVSLTRRVNIAVKLYRWISKNPVSMYFGCDQLFGFEARHGFTLRGTRARTLGNVVDLRSPVRVE